MRKSYQQLSNMCLSYSYVIVYTLSITTSINYSFIITLTIAFIVQILQADLVDPVRVHPSGSVPAVYLRLSDRNDCLQVDLLRRFSGFLRSQYSYSLVTWSITWYVT